MKKLKEIEETVKEDEKPLPSYLIMQVMPALNLDPYFNSAYWVATKL